MAGERDLERLLATMEPELQPGRLFATVAATCSPRREPRCNVVAGGYHDHPSVPYEQGADAAELLAAS
jgi:hypothetical protein